MQTQPSDADFVILWYFALTMVMFVLICSMGTRLARIELRIWRLESDLKKLSADRLIGDYCLEHKIEHTRGENVES